MSNYYKKYLKYKLKYLEAKKSMSGGALLKQLLEGDIERLPSDDSDDSDDDKFEITLTNNPKEELEYILKVDKSTTIYELKIRLLRELNFDDYEGYIDVDKFIKIYLGGEEIDEDYIQPGVKLTFKYFEDLLIVPVFYDISDYSNILSKVSEESDYEERNNLRKSLIKKYIPNIKNGDMVYTGEAEERLAETSYRFYTYINDGGVEIYIDEISEYWYSVIEDLRIGSRGGDYYLKKSKTGIELLDTIYNDFRQSLLYIFDIHVSSIETLDYRPLFFNIINWSNSDKMKKRSGGYPNLYKYLNKNIGIIGIIYEDEEEDFLANMEEIKKYNKYSNIDLQCTVIEEPAN